MDKELIELLAKLDPATLSVAKDYITYLYVELVVAWSLFVLFGIGIYKGFKTLVKEING